MLFPPCQVINDNPVPGLDEYDAAPVRHRIGEAVIRIVLSVGEIEVLRRHPLAQVCPGLRYPLERTGGCGMRLVIHPHRGVGRCAPEEITPCRVQRVAVCAGIDEEGLPEGRAL